MTGERRSMRLEELLETGNIVRLFKHGDDVDAVMKMLSETDMDVTEAKPDGSSLLHSFSILGCYEVVHLLWEKGSRPTILKVDNSTVLHSAVRTQDDTQDEERARILTLFLSSDECHGNSMPLDYQNTQGWTALKLAARKNLERCVEVLVNHEADPDIPDLEHYTALHNAVGNPDILKMLLTKSKKVNAQNQDGETALYLATERTLVDSTLTLLEYNADPNIPNKEGITPLFLASRGSHFELVKALVKKGADINTQGATQNIAPLHWAAHKEHEDIALLLIENGANILLKDKEGRTPLSMASPELAAKMTTAAQKVNPFLLLPSPTSSSPCMSAHEKAIAACCNGNVQALQALHQSGVCVNYRSSSCNSSLLHMAAYCGQLSVVMYLMSQGADWRSTDKDGDTILHVACMKDTPQGQHEKTLEFLLTTPLSQMKDMPNSNGDTPVMVAARCCFVNRVKILLQFKVNVMIANHKKELPLHRCCTTDKNIEALLHLVDLCPDINVQDADGWTPLMYAAKSGSSAIVKYLTQRGADPNVRQSAGFSALYLAAQGDSASICHILLEAGADPTLSGGPQQLSPLHIAAHRGCKKVCVMLVKYGADIQQLDNDGDTPLHLAESAELKQAMLLAHTVVQAQRRPVARQQDRQQDRRQDRQQDRELTNEIALNNQNNAVNSEGADRAEGVCQKEEGEEEVPEEKVTQPDNETKELKNGSTKEWECDSSQEPNNSSTHEQVCQLQEQLLCSQQKLRELEEEVETLRTDKELLMSRNQSLTEELQRKEAAMSCQLLAKLGRSREDWSGSSPAWWMVDSSQYEITGPQLNAANYVGKFFDVFPGNYRNMPVVVRKVKEARSWEKKTFCVFKKEIIALSQLRCPYIVQFLGAAINPCKKLCVILTEQMERGCLQKVLHDNQVPLDWNTKLSIVKDTCCGMAFIHSHQILHRNLLPCNILIGKHFNAKISDFGFFETKTKCKFYAEVRAQCTSPQVYMAPEAMERFEFTAAADIYSFGIIMWEVATGQRPFASELQQLSPVVLVMRLLMGLRPSFTPSPSSSSSSCSSSSSSSSVPLPYQKMAERCWHGNPTLRPMFSTVLSELREM